MIKSKKVFKSGSYAIELTKPIETIEEAEEYKKELEELKR